MIVTNTANHRRALSQGVRRLIVELYSCPSGTFSLFFCFYLFGFSYNVTGIDVRLHSFFLESFFRYVNFLRITMEIHLCPIQAYLIIYSETYSMGEIKQSA